MSSTSAHTLNVPPGFSLEVAVCSYGFFMLAPNAWLKVTDGCERATFSRPLCLHGGFMAQVSLGQATVGPDAASSAPVTLQISVEHTAGQGAPEVPVVHEAVLQQVQRMLRLGQADSAHIARFQEQHPKHATGGFGRLFRSPTLWEDVVKSILLCCCGWNRTVSMNAALCAKVGGGAFPTPAQVAAWDIEALKQECGLGYRAGHIHKLAGQVESGEADLQLLQAEAEVLIAHQLGPTISDEEVEDGWSDLYKRLLKLPGIGPFGAANLLQLLGCYHRIACDSETLRHLQCHRGLRLGSCSAAALQKEAQKVYQEYHPYQFLAYWSELWASYEAAFGPASAMHPSTYSLITGSNMRKALEAAASDGNKGGRTGGRGNGGTEVEGAGTRGQEDAELGE